MANKLKPILVIRLPLAMSMAEVAACTSSLHNMPGLTDDYHIIVANTHQATAVFEVSCQDDVTGVHLKQFKQFKTIIENGKNGTDSKSGKSEQ